MIHSLLAFIEEKCTIWFYPSLHSNSLRYLSKQYEKIIMLIKKTVIHLFQQYSPWTQLTVPQNPEQAKRCEFNPNQSF